MIFSIIPATSISLLLFPLSSNAFWVLSHGSLTQDRLDPILTPGAVSTHVHNIVGASNFGPNVTVDSLQASNCTTAPVQDDLSSYWAPQLYHHNTENNTYTLIPISFVNTYYLQRDGPTQKNISAFPIGLRVIAGNPYRTSYNASNVADKAVSFVCLDNKQSPQTNEFPTTNCNGGLRAQITFPSCWNGQDLDPPDHQSHMSYPVGGAPDSGDCPSTHPYKVITLFHEWIFDVGKFDFKSGEKNWVFSFGDELGYGFHADFVNGWKEGVLEAAIEQCTGNLFGDVEQCPPFASSIKRDVASNCKIPSVVEEPIVGPLSALPGCNPVPVTKDAQCPGIVTPQIKGGEGNNSSGSSSSSNSTSPSIGVSSTTSGTA